jgi:uncharacterized membrane protein
MLGPKSRTPAIIALVGSILGLVFAATSTFDYAAHLDRRLHDVHCSFIPGAPATSEAEACRAAMYSPYAALFRENIWGGIPISLFAIGAFAFFLGFSVYLLIAGASAPRKAVGFFGVVGITPLIVSAIMFTISATQLHSFCKVCVGIYAASFLLALGALLGLFGIRKSAGPAGDPEERPAGSWMIPVAWLPALGAVSLIPAAVYASGVPNHRPYLDKCGTIKRAPTATDGLLPIKGARSVKDAVMFEDPLCPTCRGFHQRLKGEGVYERLDIKLALFPLDSTCNWMLDSALHPGACTVSKAVICGGDRAKEVLDWAYDEQDDVARAGKSGEPTLRALIEKRWGAAILKCIDSKEAAATLNHHLHFASDNSIPVSTPQVYLGKLRLCDEDTDMGLRYTLGALAPEVLK